MEEIEMSPGGGERAGSPVAWVKEYLSLHSWHITLDRAERLKFNHETFKWERN